MRFGPNRGILEGLGPMLNILNSKMQRGDLVLRQIWRLLWSRRQRRALVQLAPALDGVRSGGQSPVFHYAQDAEDVALLEILPSEGFYVDIGAHLPGRFSVTKLLYDRRWRGINLDVTRQMMPGGDFSRRGPRDTNVHGIVGESFEVEFYQFRESALIAIDPKRARFLSDSGQEWKPI